MNKDGSNAPSDDDVRMLTATEVAGLVRLIGGKHSATFPNAIVIFRPLGHRIVAASESISEN